MLAASPSSARRDLRIDSLRGLLLVFMAIDHIPSDLQVFTNHIFGYVSSAEGFVFIAGLVAGLVYTRRRRTDGPVVAQESSWRRAAVLYGWHMALYLFVVVTSQSDVASWHTLLAGATLLNQPPLLDILPMYCAFMLLLPALLDAFDRGRRAQVLAVSFAVWAASNALLSPEPWTLGAVRTSSFSITAWQLLFVAGAACGHGWTSGDRIVPQARASLIALAGAFCVACYLVRHAFVAPPMPRATLDWLTNKNSLAPLRLANTAALYYLVFTVANRFPHAMQWRPFAFLGKNALHVFCAHVAVAYLVGAYPGFFNDTAVGRWVATLAMLGAMATAAFFASRRRRAARVLVPQPA